MKASIELIAALRRAADRIEDPNGGYTWEHPRHCNCGVLASELGIDQARMPWGEPWTERAARCSLTGKRLSGIWKTLARAGVDLDDLGYVEQLDDPIVMKRLGWEPEKRHSFFRTEEWRHRRFAVPANVSRYFRAQADILEEQLLQGCGTPYRDCASDHGSGCATGKPVVEPRTAGHHCKPPSAKTALAKVMPCYHLYLAQCCVYCGHVEPATAPVREEMSGEGAAS